MGDITYAEKRAFEHGYNVTVNEHIDTAFGPGAMRAALDGVQQRRKEAYDRYFAEQQRKAE